MLLAHRAISIVLVAFVALGSIYSITTPLFEAPDENWHFAFVQYVATGHGLPVQSTGQLMHFARQEGSQPPLYYLLAVGATFWIDTSDFPAIVWENPHYGYNVPGIVNDNKNLFIHTSLENFPWRGAVLAIHLARLLSLFMGALAVLFTYLLALEVLPNRKTLAASAGAFVGFVPQFLFVSSAVSNDSTIVAMAALALWLMTRQKTYYGRMTMRVLALGVACGLAALAKVSGLGLFALAVLVVIWQARNHRNQWRTVFLNLVLLGWSFAVIAGWWYLRNSVLYGELTGTQMMTQIFGARQTPLTWAQLLVQLNEVWETFWIGFGWGNIRAPQIVYMAVGVCLIISTLGWLIAIRKPQFPIRKSLFVLLLAWIAMMLAALINWMQSTQAPHGRLFFPALPAIAVLMVCGFDALNFRVARFTFRFVPLVAGSLFIVAALAPFLLLQPAYAYPSILNASQIPATLRPVDIVYGDKLKLIGYEVSSQRAGPGESITLTLYWQALAQMDDDYSIGIRLLDAEQNAIGARDSYPGHGMLPTRLWQAGQIIRDEYWLPIASDAKPGVAQIQISLYQRETKSDLASIDPQGNTITPRIGKIKVSTPTPVAAPLAQNPADFVFGKQIALTGYDLIHAALPNQEFELVLYWKRVGQIDFDYTVFVHALGADGKTIAQQDRALLHNPTSLWDDGEIIIDRYLFSLPVNTLGANRIQVGWYRADTGERLPVRIDKIESDHFELNLPGAVP